MKNSSNGHFFWNLYYAWTQGGSDEIYRNVTECYEWLKDGQVDEDLLTQMTDDELAALAEEICAEYEREKEDAE